MGRRRTDSGQAASRRRADGGQTVGRRWAGGERPAGSRRASMSSRQASMSSRRASTSIPAGIYEHSGGHPASSRPGEHSSCKRSAQPARRRSSFDCSCFCNRQLLAWRIADGGSIRGSNSNTNSRPVDSCHPCAIELEKLRNFNIQQKEKLLNRSSAPLVEPRKREEIAAASWNTC